MMLSDREGQLPIQLNKDFVKPVEYLESPTDLTQENKAHCVNITTQWADILLL